MAGKRTEMLVPAIVGTVRTHASSSERKECDWPGAVIEIRKREFGVFDTRNFRRLGVRFDDVTRLH